MKYRQNTAETETPEQLIEHISRLMAEAEAMLAGPVTPEEESSRLCDIKNRLETARTQLGEVYGRARNRVRAGVRYTDQTIREYPYHTIAMALGIGVLIGVLLKRESSRPNY